LQLKNVAKAKKILGKSSLEFSFKSGGKRPHFTGIKIRTLMAEKV
jgi:hypothetical protein